MTWRLDDLTRFSTENLTHVGDAWIPARPVECRSLFQRIREAWAVFTGRADSFIWPGDQ